MLRQGAAKRTMEQLESWSSKTKRAWFSLQPSASSLQPHSRLRFDQGHRPIGTPRTEALEVEATTPWRIKCDAIIRVSPELGKERHRHGPQGYGSHDASRKPGVPIRVRIGIEINA